ncbi:MAG: hypothetical protein WB987_14475 [Candidatus Acidiferrales bacterium]
MNRRDFVRLGWATVIAAGAGKLRPAFAQLALYAENEIGWLE